MTKTDCRIPDGPSPLEDSWETQCVRPSNVILASGTARQVGVMCWRMSDWYWCRVLGLRSARDSSHASAYSPKVMRPRAGSVQSPCAISERCWTSQRSASLLRWKLLLRSRRSGPR